jgi:hypothetical protein
MKRRVRETLPFGVARWYQARVHTMGMRRATGSSRFTEYLSDSDSRLHTALGKIGCSAEYTVLTRPAAMRAWSSRRSYPSVCAPNYWIRSTRSARELEDVYGMLPNVWAQPFVAPLLPKELIRRQDGGKMEDRTKRGPLCGARSSACSTQPALHSHTHAQDIHVSTTHTSSRTS